MDWGLELVRAEAQLGVDDLLINAQSRGRNQSWLSGLWSNNTTPATLLFVKMGETF